MFSTLPKMKLNFLVMSILLRASALNLTCSKFCCLVKELKCLNKVWTDYINCSNTFRQRRICLFPLIPSSLFSAVHKKMPSALNPYQMTKFWTLPNRELLQTTKKKFDSIFKIHFGRVELWKRVEHQEKVENCGYHIVFLKISSLILPK